MYVGSSILRASTSILAGKLEDCSNASIAAGEQNEDMAANMHAHIKLLQAGYPEAGQWKPS